VDAEHIKVEEDKLKIIWHAAGIEKWLLGMWYLHGMHAFLQNGNFPIHLWEFYSILLAFAPFLRPSLMLVTQVVTPVAQHEVLPNQPN